jgi:hypothetical protein
MLPDTGQRMFQRGGQHQPSVEKLMISSPSLHRSGRDADVGRAFLDAAHDVVVQPFFQRDVDLRMRARNLPSISGMNSVTAVVLAKMRI